MHSLESGTAAARDADSMHPLWEEWVHFYYRCPDGRINSDNRYAFPYEELADGIIDITEERKPFYFNPYSGELSLVFPRAERKCRGGILACVAVDLR